MNSELRKAAEREWVDANEPLVGLALEAFAEFGEWPKVADAQRTLDRTAVDLDVAEALARMPRLKGQPQPYQQALVTLPMRVLWHFDAARPLLDSCLVLVRLAREVYLSTAENLVVESDDARVQSLGPPAFVRRASQLVSSDHPNPFAGGGGSDTGWSLGVNGAMARLLPGVKTLPDYFEWQAEIVAQANRERSREERLESPLASSGGDNRRVVAALRAVQIGGVHDRLVLLGAGASVEAGLPDGRRLADALRGSDQLPMLAGVLDRLDADGFPDVERAFSILEAIADSAREGSLVADLARLDFIRSPVQFDPAAAAEELETVRSELRRRLWLPDGLGAGVAAAILQQEYTAPQAVEYLLPLLTASVGGSIATLNYDNTIELAGGQIVRAQSPETRRVRLPKEEEGTVCLLKLHGSLNWQRIGDDVIRGGRPLDSEVYEPGVIFGAGNKLRHYGPYLDLLRAFNEKLASAHFVVVIGYGFRDPHINEALRVWATTAAGDGRNKTMHVCLGAKAAQLPPLALRWRLEEHLNIHLTRENAGRAIELLFQ